MLAALTLLAVCVTLYLFSLRYKHTYWARRGIPHDEPVFPKGNLQEYRTSKHICEITQDTYEKFKGTGLYAGFYMLLSPTVVALDLDFVKNVLIKDFNSFTDRGAFFNEIDDPLTGNLFHMDGPKWRQLRKRLTPVFTLGKIKLMFPMVQGIADELIAVLGDKLQECPDTLEVTDFFARYTTDVIGSCAFGLDCNSLRNADGQFLRNGQTLVLQRRHQGLLGMFIESYPALARRLHFRRIPQACHDFYMGTCRNTVDYRQANNVKTNDFMGNLIDMLNSADSESRITFNDLAAQAFVFLIAGFDTSQTTISCAIFELARNPEIQDELRREIRQVLARHNNQLTYESIKEMPLLDRIICETLRMYPPLPNLNRKCVQRYETSDSKYFIEKDTHVIIPVYAIHHDANIYPDPYRFDPDRFTDAEVKKRHPCAWLPFGEGPRNCIGMRFGKMQTAVGIIELIRNFQFSVCKQTQTSIKLKPQSRLINVAGGIQLSVAKVAK